ncbi:uncharacterized protein LOC8268051 [Ricinus communis]|uniref:uncharacterized protein LOC8268051 n=1 Tax=Ricinus communis TaxID=3988 RepID=UPI00201B184F|nr:uncharacterized protein LOC8268051 [Ricinus communis]
MCSSKSRLHHHGAAAAANHHIPASTIAKINGRPVLQPKSDQVPTLERRNSLKKNSPKSPIIQPPAAPLPLLPTTTTIKPKQPSSLSPPISPKLKSPRPPALKRGNDLNTLNSSAEKFLTPRKAVSTTLKKSKKSSPATPVVAETCTVLNYSSSLIVEAPGSIAAARREHVATMQEQRKLRTAHYGRVNSGSKSKRDAKIVPVDSPAATAVPQEERRCSFITPSSDPIYVAYHDQEWGVPVHDDKMLFELLVLTGAQIGSDWTSVLKKREAFREAFSGFDAEIVAKFSEKKTTSISAEYGMEISQVRGVVDNSNRILQVKKEFGSFDKYLWGFVNHKPITTQYRSSNKIPVKTSKSETISKDMVKRGFRYVGPTVMHSFMQAAGLSNDHLITCSRHHQCLALAS